MQVSFRKLALATALFLGLSSSLMANEDLLAMATNGAVEASTTTQALSQDEMKEVVGGYYYTPIVYNTSTKSAIYANAFVRSFTLNAMSPWQRLAVLTTVKK